MKAAYEPTDEECKWTADEEEELTVSKQVLVTYTPACPSSHFGGVQLFHVVRTQLAEPTEHIIALTEVNTKFLTKGKEQIFSFAALRWISYFMNTEHQPNQKHTM